MRLQSAILGRKFGIVGHFCEQDLALIAQDFMSHHNAGMTRWKWSFGRSEGIKRQRNREHQLRPFVFWYECFGDFA
jgi:hypothetical protein